MFKLLQCSFILHANMVDTEDPMYSSYFDMDDGDTDDEGGSQAPLRSSGQSAAVPRTRRSRSLARALLEPQSRWVQEWNHAFLLVSAAGLFVDPLFFYALSISGTRMCLFVDGWYAVTVTLLRCMTDIVHILNIWLRLKIACRKNGVDANVRAVALNYLNSKTGLFDMFVISPLPQVVLWVAVPALIQSGSTLMVMNIFLIMFLVHYLPKIYHWIGFMRRMQNSSGYIFGTIWWGIALNLIAYFVAAHAAGACWYLLGIQRAMKCLNEQCLATNGCGPKTLGCINPIYYGSTAAIGDKGRLAWANHTSAKTVCLDSSDNYDYGAFEWSVLLITNPSRVEKLLLPVLWGLMTLSTFGGALECTTNWPEIIFNIIVVTSGLLLVTMLIGNIKVFLHSMTAKKQALHLKMRSLEWWMKQRRLPQEIRKRVRRYERQRWAAMWGVDECQIVRNLPDGLRKNIKYYLCLDLVSQVPLFQHMDEIVLENICDRVKSLIFPKGEIITKEGDPVQRMIFVVRGHLESSQVLRDGVKSCCMLGPGNFSGDELLSWCLRRPFIERLPPSSSTLVTLESTEAFGLDASDVKYITQHFRYVFMNDKVKRSARYYSPGWRTWAAVAVQLAWRRYKRRLLFAPISFVWPRKPTSQCSTPGEERLRHYAALLTSPKPNRDDLS